MDPVVLRLPRLDHHPQDEPSFVLVHVTSAGAHPLDLDLIGTDNDAGFSVSLRYQPLSLGKKKSSDNQEDWESILSFILLGTAPGPDRAAVTEDVEAVAKVDGNLTITLQKNVQGIKSLLGTITLAEDAEALEKIDLFEWCGQVVNSKNATASELASREKAFREKDEQAKKLEDTLVKLQKQKNEHENDLLEKFSLLLNEKKLKIRDQQRLLASLNVDPARLAAVEENRNERHHSAGPSRRGKRKARPRVQGDDDDEESDGFEDMDVDEAPNESEQDQPQTPPPEDESTADEASEDEEAPVPPPTRRNHRGSPAEATSSRAPPLPKDAAVPPKRELPFQKKPTPAKPAPVINGSETESDDEL